MQHRFFSGINPPKYLIKKTGALTATRLNSTLRRENLSLAGCSSAEPASVSVQQRQNSNSFSIFTTCQKNQPFANDYWLNDSSIIKANPPFSAILILNGLFVPI